jgi:hypothetical protein
MEVEWQIWYSQHITWKLNDRYDTVNISDESGMTDMIQSTYQMEVDDRQCIYTLNIISENMIPLFLFIIFCFIQVRLLFFLFISHGVWECVDTDYFDYQMEVEWQIWYSQHITWKLNDRYDTVNISDGSEMTYDTVHLICWLYHICHSTSIWYVDCIISIIPLPSDILSVSYLSF